MIALRPLHAREFPAFAAYFVPDYAAEIVGNFGIPLEDALIQAAQDLAQDLPQGVNTEGQSLLAITNTDTLVGYLFYAIDPATHSAFIKDFHVLAPYQSQGFGSAAIALLVAQLKPLGITQLRLRVAAKNAAAHRLYTRLGFFPTGINMAKSL